MIRIGSDLRVYERLGPTSEGSAVAKDPEQGYLYVT